MLAERTVDMLALKDARMVVHWATQLDVQQAAGWAAQMVGLKVECLVDNSADGKAVPMADVKAVMLVSLLVESSVSCLVAWWAEEHVDRLLFAKQYWL
jgi:hypothetical protein